MHIAAYAQLHDSPDTTLLVLNIKPLRDDELGRFRSHLLVQRETESVTFFTFGR